MFIKKANFPEHSKYIHFAYSILYVKKQPILSPVITCSNHRKYRSSLYLKSVQTSGNLSKLVCDVHRVYSNELNVDHLQYVCIIKCNETQ